MTELTEYSLDIDTAEQDLLLGPQAELLDLVTRFNTNYSTTRDETQSIVSVTKKFRFKNGVYNNIKKAYGDHCLAFNMKPNGIWSLKERIDRYQWRSRSFWSSLNTIEEAMRRLRNNNVFWQDNTELIKSAYESLQEKVETGCQSAFTVDPECEINVEIDDENGYKNLKIVTTITVKNIQLKVFLQDDEAGSIDWGDVKIRFKHSLWQYLNVFCDGGHGDWSRLTGYGQSYQAKPKYYKMLHPYLGRAYNEREGWNSHMCQGDLSSPIRESSASMNMESLVTYMRLWLGRYHIPRTNPLNRITGCFFGLPDTMEWRVLHNQNDEDIDRRQKTCQWPSRYWDHYKLVNMDENTGAYQCGTDMDGNPNLWQIDNACDVCQFREAGETDSGIKFDKCANYLSQYIGPEDDNECITEQLFYLVMCENFIWNHRHLISENDSGLLREYTDEHDISWTDSCDIFFIREYVSDFAFDYYYHAQKRRWGSVHEDVPLAEQLMEYFVDNRLRANLEDRYFEIDFPNGLSEDGEGDAIYDEWRDDVEGMSTAQLAQAIENAPARALIIEANRPTRSESWDPLAITNNAVEDGLTAEERTIRWAAQRGGSINI